MDLVSDPRDSLSPGLTLTVDVLCPVGLDTALTYVVPPGLSVVPGDLVEVPLGARMTQGVVWSVPATASSGRAGLKAIGRVVDPGAVPDTLRAFVDWVAAWTLAPRGLVLRMAQHDPEKGGPEPPRLGVRLTGMPTARATPARLRVVAAADGGLLFPRTELARLASVGTGVIDGLIDEGVLEPAPMPRDIPPQPDPDCAAPVLSPEQADAAQALRQMLAGGDFSVALLEGVTGSGKTEVYFEAAAQALRMGRQTLILMPEIALTGPFLDRFEARFGARPAEWHSGVVGRRRERVFAAIRSGEARVVIGARSALFLPFRDLGLIVVDEEHEGAYKQEDGVCYHARDMAVVRARIGRAAVVLASATPSVETRVNAQAGRYSRLVLPMRHGARALPAIELIDMRREAPPPGRWISERLAQAVRATLQRGDQALLFLNRRGYAPLTLCQACGHRLQCPHCTAWLVEHRFTRSLRCHHCGHREPVPRHCTACGSVDALTARGPGIERLAEEAATLFPDARTLALSSDMPGGIARMRRELADIADRKVDLVIGTQLVAKGHHFPGLALVGVVDADLGSASADPRAGERTFQVLQQVSGRAGRGDTSGMALLQTYDPGRPAIRALASGDVEAFYAGEIAMRRQAGLPPFGRLASLLVTAASAEEARGHARALALCAEATVEIMVLGPAEAPIAVIRGRHRWRLLVKAPRSIDLQAWLRGWLARAPKARGSVRVAVDVDPMSFL